MGSDPLTVVDNQLRVHGIVGLRVADAPRPPSTREAGWLLGERELRN
jgi:choline dehydrogenase-like flavoprotein